MQHERENGSPIGSVVKALDHYGERFLSLFDDGEVSERDAPVEDGTTCKRLKKRRKQEDGSREGSVPEARKQTVHVGTHKQQGISRKRRDFVLEEVDAIFTTIKDDGVVQKGESGMEKATKREEQDEEERRKKRMERKRFMASKSDTILRSSGDDDIFDRKSRRNMSSSKERKTEREDFRAIAREIQSFGATGLDKKAKARFEQDRLLELGAKKQKGVKISARIGHGMAKKSAQREQRALDQAIAAGMVSRKALASKKRREMKKQGVDRGLNEDMGSFRHGVLRVTPKKR